VTDSDPSCRGAWRGIQATLSKNAAHTRRFVIDMAALTPVSRSRTNAYAPVRYTRLSHCLLAYSLRCLPPACAVVAVSTRLPSRDEKRVT
jgi:hypothetical protein